MIVAAIAAAAAASSAAAADDDGFCRNGGFAIENSSFGLAKIDGDTRAYLLDDMDGCPSGRTGCRTRGYVIPGDLVVTGRDRNGYRCVYFPNRGGGSAGWLDPRRLKPIPVAADPPLSAWVGRWSDHGNPTARIALRRERLFVDGESYWPDPDPPLKQFPGGPNMGGIGGPLRVKGNRAHEDECNVDFTLVGDFMVGSDPDMKCGGMNVSFSGVYRRERR
jgi:hypothetical protein